MSLGTTIFLAIFALAFMSLNFWRREWGVAAFCAILPAYLIRLRIGLPGHFSAPSTFLEILFWVMFLPWLFERGLRAESWRSLSRWLGPIALIMIGSIIGILVSPDMFGGLGIWRAYFLEPILFFVMFVDTMSDAKRRRLAISALLAGATLISLTAIFQKFTGFGIPDPWQAEEVRRVTSFYGFPNAVGLFVAPLAVLAAAWSSSNLLRGFGKGKVESRRMLLVAFVLCISAVLGLAACVFAVSKGAIIGIAAGLAVYGLSVRKIRLYALAAIALACLVVISYRPLTNLAGNIIGGRDASSSVRLIVWDESINMLADRPIFGAGLNGYQMALVPYHKAMHIEIFMYPHSFFLNFWTEIGLIGLAGFVWLLILFFAYCVRLARSGRTWLPLGLIAAMVTVLVHGMVDVPYFKNDLAFLFWILIGLTGSLMEQSERRPGLLDIAKRLLRLDDTGKS